MNSFQSSQVVLGGLATAYVASIFGVGLLSDDLTVPFLHSEWLCWIILLVAARFSKSKHFGQDEHHGNAEKLSLGIAAACLCWAFSEARWTVVSR